MRAAAAVWRARAPRQPPCGARARAQATWSSSPAGSIGGPAVPACQSAWRRPGGQATATAAAAAALGVGLALSDHPLAVCSAAAPFLSAVQIADISSMILDSYSIPLVPSTLRTPTSSLPFLAIIARCL